MNTFRIQPTNNKSILLKFPSELWLEIFLFLDSADIYQAACRVCSMWGTLTASAEFREQFYAIRLKKDTIWGSVSFDFPWNNNSSNEEGQNKRLPHRRGSVDLYQQRRRFSVNLQRGQYVTRKLNFPPDYNIILSKFDKMCNLHTLSDTGVYKIWNTSFMGGTGQCLATFQLFDSTYYSENKKSSWVTAADFEFSGETEHNEIFLIYGSRTGRVGMAFVRSQYTSFQQVDLLALCKDDNTKEIKSVCVTRCDEHGCESLARDLHFRFCTADTVSCGKLNQRGELLAYCKEPLFKKETAHPDNSGADDSSANTNSDNHIEINEQKSEALQYHLLKRENSILVISPTSAIKLPLHFNMERSMTSCSGCSMPRRGSLCEVVMFCTDKQNISCFDIDEVNHVLCFGGDFGVYFFDLLSGDLIQRQTECPDAQQSYTSSDHLVNRWRSRVRNVLLISNEWGSRFSQDDNDGAIHGLQSVVNTPNNGNGNSNGNGNHSMLERTPASVCMFRKDPMNNMGTVSINGKVIHTCSFFGYQFLGNKSRPGNFNMACCPFQIQVGDQVLDFSCNDAERGKKIDMLYESICTGEQRNVLSCYQLYECVEVLRRELHNPKLDPECIPPQYRNLMIMENVEQDLDYNRKIHKTILDFAKHLQQVNRQQPGDHSQTNSTDMEVDDGDIGRFTEMHKITSDYAQMIDELANKQRTIQKWRENYLQEQKLLSELNQRSISLLSACCPQQPASIMLSPPSQICEARNILKGFCAITMNRDSIDESIRQPILSLVDSYEADLVSQMLRDINDIGVMLSGYVKEQTLFKKMEVLDSCSTHIDNLVTVDDKRALRGLVESVYTKLTEKINSPYSQTQKYSV